MIRRATTFAAAAGLAAALVVLPAPGASAAATHVGLVVRYSNGSVATACATAGGSGLAVLERKFSVVIGQQPPYAGFVFTINGTGSTRPDTTHYWSYWHGASGGGWTYSSTGAGTYTPKAGTVEGWSYVNGSSSATKPPVYTYAALCASSDPKAAPTTQRTTATTTSRSPAGATTSTRRTQSAQAAAPTGSATPLTTRRTGSSTGSSASTSAGTSTGTSASAASATSALTSMPVPSPSTSPVGATRHNSGGVPAWTTVLAIVVVAGIASFALVRSRRAR